MAGNPLASLPGLPQRPSLARSSASETRLTQPGIEGARSRKLNSAPTAAFRLKHGVGWKKRFRSTQRARPKRCAGRISQGGPDGLQNPPARGQRVMIKIADTGQPAQPAARPPVLVKSIDRVEPVD